MVFRVEPRTITKWVNELGMPKSGRGQYDLFECVYWRCTYLEKKIKTLTEGGSEGMNQNTRLKKVTSEIKEYQLAKLRGELVALDDVMPVFTEALSKIRTMAQSFGQRVGSELEGMNNLERTEVLQDRINELLTTLTKVPDTLRRLEKFTRHRNAESVFGVEASAKNDSKSVGRRKSHLVTRNKSGTGKVQSK